MAEGITKERFEEMLGGVEPQDWTELRHRKTRIESKSETEIDNLTSNPEKALRSWEEALVIFEQTSAKSLLASFRILHGLATPPVTHSSKPLASKSKDDSGEQLREIVGRLAKIEEQISEVICPVGRTVFIQNLRNPQYKLTQPIPIYIESVEDGAIASYYDIDMYGEGDDEQSAMDDLCGAIIEYYESLLEDPNILGPMPKQELEFLRDLIEKTDANKKR